MKTQASTLKEWTSFLVDLNNRKTSGQPLLKKAASPYKIVDHLQRQFTVQKEEVFVDRWYTVTKVKRKKTIPGQLSFWQ